MMSLWDALRMNMMISYQELVRTFPKAREEFLTKFRRAQASSAETFTRQILFITAGCTIVGAAVGAAIAILLLR
ncbi:hypothetical protein AB8Z46_29100 (plasmid) [Klebsiella pneumoniae subsp. pneumoniae]|uniref:hypothetical protein n=1 Tax=Klebsiella pneumoniae TaxID=573 RepID=UPI003518C65C